MEIRIAIIEDEKSERDYLHSLLRSWFTERDISIIVSEFPSAEAFLFQYPEQFPFSLIFTDVMMGSMNGCDLAKYIRERDKNVQLVFLTGVTEYVYEGYKLGLLRYLLKPLREEELNLLLTDATEEILKSNKDFFSFSYQGETIRLHFSQVIYAKVDGHYVKMKTKDKEYEWKSSLALTKEMLYKDCFVMANRSTLVNLLYVKKITKEFCILETGEEIPVSRNEYGKVNSAFIQFYI